MTRIKYLIAASVIWGTTPVSHAYSQQDFNGTLENPQKSELETAPLEENLVEQNRVVLRALDKITARITEIELAVGDEYRFGTLALVARYCRTSPPIEPPETFAFLEIDDLKRGGERERIFEGWMVASSPALNAMEHPVYDVWVINCKIVEPESDSLSR